MDILKTRAVALKDYKFLEQDKIVIFYTQDFGIFKVVAKGARRIKSRFAVAVQFPSYIDILVYRRKSLNSGILSDCRIRHLFPGIRKNIFRFAYASYLAEILLSSLKEGQVNKALFSLLLRALFTLEQGKKEDFGIVSSFFKLKLFHLVGYTPQLKRCVECGKNRDYFNSFYFAPAKGGILCEECGKKDIQAIGTSRTAVLAMDYLLYNGKITAPTVPGGHGIEKQINSLLDAYFLFHIDGEKGSSWSLIKHLEKLK